ncbi:MAG: endonuclease/exonuclease/phosphatase family metal-dependent hydrolase [Gammaproteobacteria bacterium]|jgi:endonuclease/exonuclease/phosphatase family metal-dependent hydrolase
MFKVITFNAAILDVCIFGHSFYRPVDHIEARLQCLAASLLQTDADIIFLQELFHRDKQDSLCGMLKKSYPFVKGLAPSGWKFRLGNELLTLSRFPLLKGNLHRFAHAPAEELRHTSKGFYHLQAELPGLGTINLINFHMSAGGKHQHPESSAMETLREKQIRQLLDYVEKLDKTLLAGDLNAGPEASNRNYQQLLSAGYFDLFTDYGAKGITWDPENPLVLRGSEAHLPAQRIDHFFADETLNDCTQVAGAEIIFTEHCVGISGGHIPLSDHYALSLAMDAK